MAAKTTIIEQKNDAGETIYRINRKTKKGKYFLVNSDGKENRQKKMVDGPILLEGFVQLPGGFYKNDGYGLTTAGSFIIQEIFDHFGKKLKVTVAAARKGKIDGRGKVVNVTIPHTQLSKLGQVTRNIKRERNEETRVEIQHFLGQNYSQFKHLKDSQVGYIPGRLAELLDAGNVTSKLSTEDRDVLESFIPNYLSSIPGTLRAKKKLQVIFDTLDAGQKIYLEKVLKEFRKKLSQRVQNENTWQKFLSNYILVLQHNYGEVLEKESVSLQGKFPDFMLVDPYGYLDIYEIKKPTTTLMRFDKSRNNYFWDTEITKAIAQVENYMYQAQRHADTLMNDIRKAKEIDVNIVRPRGYIIAGVRSQLTSDKMKDDFRILCESLKNIDVILYDDLLESLENFVARAQSKE